MSGDYIEAFEKTRLAGIIAARALDEVAKIAKPGVRTDTLDKLCYEFLNDHMPFLLLYFIEVSQNHVAHQQIMLSVTEFLLKKFLRW